MELLLVALAPFILFALFFDRFDFEKAEAVPEGGEPEAGGPDSARQPEGRLNETRRSLTRSRRRRGFRSPGAATWN
jgi:hypothetical protein